MLLPDHKTKIVATIGPATESVEMLQRLIGAGLNIARLNFSHGDFTEHAERIERIRAAERATGRRVTIMADLPGPKMRVGKIDPEPIQLQAGDPFTLTAEPVVGNAQRVSMSFEPLPRVVKPGQRLFLNDGLVELKVERTAGDDVQCKVIVGGELRSRKGLNLPGIDLGISAFTEHDRACLEFALQHGVEALSQSFVERAADLEAVRAAAKALGKHPFIIAKIERAGALEHLDEILKAADGIMVARGDLGVEVPIQEIALTQKRLVAMANLAGKPVIIATQMLESMVTSRLPTRAEATDVANAILDGTDCLMLSAESAVGKYPVEAVAMLASIAAATEAHRPPARLLDLRAICRDRKADDRRGGDRHGRGECAGDGALCGRAGADPNRRHRADDLALQARGVGGGHQPRRRGWPWPGFLLRRLSHSTGGGPGELARLCPRLAAGAGGVGQHRDAGGRALPAESGRQPPH